jgi:hypothetical protein
VAKAVSISLSKLTASVQSAVKAAVAKHPKFKVDAPNALTVSYLIRGIPVPESILAHVTVGETQAFAADIAQHLASAHPEVAQTAGAAAPEGAIISVGRHVVVGIPPAVQSFQVEK